MQPNDPGFTPPTAVPPGPPSGAAASKVMGPAVGLIVTGALGVLAGLVNIFARGAVLAALAAQDPNLRHMPMGSAAGSVIGGVWALATGGFVIFAGVQMMKLRAYGLAFAGAILALVPCLGPCCCVGIPAGIWALVVLNSADVKASFQP